MMLFAADFEFSGQGLATEASRATGQTGSQFLGGLPESGVSLAQIERDLLVAALAKFGGNQTKAARYLNISRRTLIYRMGKFNLRPAVNSEDR
jgi:two-component system NtrC family response regulator